MEAFEAGGYKTASVAGLHLLNCLLRTFPDNKIVEDVRNDIWRDGEFQSNKKQTNESIQDITRRKTSLKQFMRTNLKTCCPPERSCGEVGCPRRLGTAAAAPDRSE